MLPDRVSNPGPLTYESGALPIALRGPANSLCSIYETSKGQSEHLQNFIVQSTLVISKSKGPSKTLRDIRTSTYQICSIEEKTIRTTKFHK